MNSAAFVPTPRMSDNQRNLFLGLLLLLSFALYGNSIFDGFVYDDHSQIEHNPYVHSFSYIGKLFASGLLAQQGKQAAPNFYRPLINLSFLFCYKLFGLSPSGFHLISVLINCVVVWMVFRVSAELLQDDWVALAAATIFALHPVHTEPTAWIDGISDLELSFFYLLTFLMYLQRGKNTTRPVVATALMMGTFLLALFSKEPAMTLPVLIMVFEHFYSADRQSTTWFTKFSRYVWLWVTLAAYLALRTFSVGRVVPARLHSDISFTEMIYTAFALIGQYAKMLIWPHPLVAFYPFHKSTSFFEPAVLQGLAALVITAVLFFTLWRTHRIYSFAIPWIGLLIAPALNARWLTATVFAERYLYLPSVGLCWLAAGATVWLWRRPIQARTFVRVATAVGLVILGCFSAQVIVRRNRDWSSDRALIVSTLAVLPDSPNMRVEFGWIKWNEGDHADAVRQWNLALATKPDAVEAISYLGLAALEDGRYDEAITFLNQAIALKPRFATPHIHLGRVYEERGQYDLAEQEFRRALDIHPTNTQAMNALGDFYLSRGRWQDAEQQFVDSVSIMSDLQPWLKLGRIYESQGQSQKAEEAWQQVLVFDHLNPEAHRAMGKIYLERGQWKLAGEEFEACLLMDAGDAQSLRGLEKVKSALGAPANAK